MISFEDIKIFLPKYLTPDSSINLFEELNSFPDNIDSRLYSMLRRKDDVIYQGDGLNNLQVIFLPDTKIRPASAMILSNTCDINPKNERPYKTNIVYCPILKVNKYEKILQKAKFSNQDIIRHLNDIRAQRISSVFYLPKIAGLETESFIFFDKPVNCRRDFIPTQNINERKLFTLSNYGLYLFILKLSIHFTRIQEGIDRDK